VANRLSAAPVRPEKAAASTLEPAVNPVRSRSLLLLKTTLRHRLRLLPGASRTHQNQYSYGADMAQCAARIRIVQSPALSSGYTMD
jgi:hypothetical protein